MLTSPSNIIKNLVPLFPNLNNMEFFDFFSIFKYMLYEYNNLSLLIGAFNVDKNVIEDK